MTDTSSAGLVTIDVQEILRFFDEKADWASGPTGKSHVSGIVGVFGEDLNAACFQRYMESKCHSVTVRPEPVTTGERCGPRLDRWIVVDCSDGRKTVFQTEIKNWSSRAFGGKTLPVSATCREVADYKQKRWEWRWDSERGALKERAKEKGEMAKVLVPMKLPSGLEDYANDIRPLLIFWEAIGPKADEHLFRMDTSNYEFPSIWVFSVSSYLRSIREASIELEMPDAADRLRILRRLLK